MSGIKWDEIGEHTNAVSKGSAMMRVPFNQLPPIAVDYAQHLCSRVGQCMETLLTAWIVYCQIVEKLPCDDSLYTPDQDAISFFKERGY